MIDRGGEDFLSEGQKNQCRRAAALEVNLEQLEANMSEGQGVDLDVYNRLAGNLRRLFETLGLERNARLHAVARSLSPSEGSGGDDFRVMDILEALADPNLFAPHFVGSSWDGWRSFLAALFALPATAAYSQCTGRTKFPDKPFAESALIVGRRGGKSRVLALIAVYLACFRDYRPYLAPGEVATIAIIAANRSQARSTRSAPAGAARTISGPGRPLMREPGIRL
jgi:hypothetical protein